MSCSAPRCIGSLFFVVLLALLVPPPSHAAWPHDPYTNVAVCTATGGQQETVACSDGAGGAIIAWVDLRSGAMDLYAQRMSAAGLPLWTANGVVVSDAAGDQYAPAIVADGQGGAFLAWEDARGAIITVYAQHINSSGVSQWTADGLLLTSNTTNNKLDPCIAPDGTGGCVVAWEDYRLGATDVNILAQRVTAAGTIWWSSGAYACGQTGNQYDPDIVGDNGGAWVVWRDYRGGLDYDIYVNRIAVGGTQVWGNGLVVCDVTESQMAPVMVSDGSGGVLIAWHDYRSATSYDIYGQRVSSTGSMTYTDGAALCTATGNQTYPAIASDGLGGAIVVWEDTRAGNDDVYAQRLTYGGVAAWTTNGVAVATGTPDADAAVIASDGLGGALIAWRDYRNSLANADVFAQRLNGSGSTMWTYNGVLVAGTPVNQFDYAIVADGANGAILAWCESRVAGYDVLCQRVERYGALGEPGPVITQVKDVPADQGGQVRLTWNGSYLDADPDYAINEYWVWREVPVSLALSARAAGTLAASGEFVTPHGRYLITSAGATNYAWEYLTALEAGGFSTYSYVAPTAYDSLPGENRWTRFMVQARSSAHGYYWNSAPDSGYSVDNVAPPVPAAFTGQYASGAATLHWEVNPAADLAEYRLYRGSTADFVPEPGNLVVARPDTGYVDAAGVPYYYKLCAVDVHGNASGFTLLLPSGTAEVPDGAALAFALEGVRPNPSYGERLSVTFALPTAAPARLELVDVSGRRVVAREVGSLGAGRHTLDLGQGTRLAPGLYLVCLRQGANTRVTRVAVLK